MVGFRGDRKGAVLIPLWAIPLLIVGAWLLVGPFLAILFGIMARVMGE